MPARLLAALTVWCAWAVLSGTSSSLAAAPGGTAQALLIAVAGLAIVGAWSAAAARVPLRVPAGGTVRPGHPARPSAGDLPRQDHPDAAGHRRPRAPGRR